jgi:antitoxin component YwqK of YwqJK toxin-antitoxin module
LSSIFCPKANAQKDTTIEFLDSGYQKTPKQKAFYARISVRKDKYYLVAMVKMEDGSKVFTGSYKDRSLSGAEGLFEFYTNNTVTMRGYYHEGVQVGTWKSWNTSGLLLDSAAFDGYGNLTADTKYTYHENKTLWRSVFNDAMNTKISKEYDTTGTLVSEGTFTNNDGQTFLYYQSGKLKAHAVFKNGERISYDFFDEDGKKYTEQEFSQLKR